MMRIGNSKPLFRGGGVSGKQMFPGRMDTPDGYSTLSIFGTASPKQSGDSKVTLFVVNVEYMVYMDS